MGRMIASISERWNNRSRYRVTCPVVLDLLCAFGETEQGLFLTLAIFFLVLLSFLWLCTPTNQTMKALRKSLTSAKDHHSSHHISTPITSPTLSRATINLPPPTRVIRATSKYRSQAPQQLSFEKGDFFHVLRDIDNQGLWYEAHNPVTGARGLVPRAMFEEFSKGNPMYALYGPLTTLLFNGC